MAQNGPSPIMELKVGLCRKDQGKFFYLTAEKLQNMINASATSMKAKQLWTIEHDDTDADVVYIRSPMGCYLAGDRHGKLTCSIREKVPETKYLLEYDGKGHWACKNLVHGLYFGGDGENLHCNGKTASPEVWWSVRLAYHPQINIKAINRNEYAHYHEQSNKIHVDQKIPWGQEAQLTLEFTDGKYAVKTCNNKYLHRNGDLVDEAWQDTLFALHLTSGKVSGLAFKDVYGNFLTSVGRNGIMQTKNDRIGKDEIFRIEQNHPQVYLKAHNGKYVSIKQGLDVSANQTEVDDTEIFQLEYVTGRHWRFRTCQNQYWFVSDTNGIQRDGNPTNSRSIFDIDYLEDGSIAIKSSTDKYVNVAQTGSMSATSRTARSKERFEMVITNKPLLELRCEHGYVGVTSTNRVQCNRSTYEQFSLEASSDPNQKGEYFLKARNGMFWTVTDDSTIHASSGEPKPFRLILRGQSKFAIRSESGQYIRGEQNGLMEAKVDLERATLWEF